MAIEIERKFLVESDAWRNLSGPGVKYCQGYLCRDATASVRVRIAGEQANINVKSAISGLSRSEFEYAIPLEDAAQMLKELCVGHLVEKTRHLVPAGDHVWEIDVFEGENEGLIVAEIELASENEKIDIPAWLGVCAAGRNLCIRALFLTVTLCILRLCTTNGCILRLPLSKRLR